uniref:Uncharacterized protein n=1 Tax=Takifugu rubripes TaxID=31033 RepID=A0A674MDV0_TAKRU
SFLDGSHHHDGALEYFYEEQVVRGWRGMGIEPLPFQDRLCQMLDLVQTREPRFSGQRRTPQSPFQLACRMAHIFFDTFFTTWKNYLEPRAARPISIKTGINMPSEEYEIFGVAEETANEQLHEG